MTERELKSLSLAEATRSIAAKQISAPELTAAVLAQLERCAEPSRAFITTMKPPPAETKHPSPLLGVPVSIKDLFDTQHIRTTAGAKFFAERIPDRDAVVVRRLKDAGAVLVGKTNLHEFAFGLTSVNPHYGTVRNPWLPDRITGGSSGGSACAVALGMGLGSIGTDTGGSIRIPAALCGIVGLKPTYGRVSMQGAVPLSWSFDHAGPMTRTVEDAAMLLEIIAGHEPHDPVSSSRPAVRYTAALTGDIKGVRIGVPSNFFFEDLDPSVETGVRTALQQLAQLGAELIAVDVPGIEIHRAVWLQIATPEAYSFHEQRIAEHRDWFGPDVLARLEPARALQSIDYVRAQRAREQIKQQCRRLFERVDVLVAPSVPIPAPRVEDLTKPWGDTSETAIAALARLTRYFNVTGIPAISVPCGFTGDGLPIGMQIAGEAFDESTVLRVAHAYEQQARWFQQLPSFGGESKD